jgi:hypothetical protein
LLRLDKPCIDRRESEVPAIARPSSDPKAWADRVHGPWIARMAGLRPGDRFHFPEADVLAAGSTLRSAKITLWHLSRAWGWVVWFQKTKRKGATILEVMREAQGRARREAQQDKKTEHLGRLVEEVRQLPPGQVMKVSSEEGGSPPALRAHLLAEGVSVSIRRAEQGCVVVRWHDDHLEAARKASPYGRAKRHTEVEATLLGLGVDESATITEPGMVDGRFVRRVGRLAGALFDVQPTGQGVLVTRRKGGPPLARVSPVRPWVERFDALAVGDSFVVSLQAVENTGSSYLALSRRLYTAAHSSGRRVSVRKLGRRAMVKRVA